ncbi:ABC transporter permease [Actinocatenispora rupis]|uniref:ABC transporter permease n=1 Tax=Actinocatenispora rupis TaxID=519421 RepID=A0A8J3NDZ4_9ACTN|nr:ABC-2 family transporter protein [Actinocatenispora rupis]GID13445.1 ABC transporter permease [Actinocatenispora rupis]
MADRPTTAAAYRALLGAQLRAQTQYRFSFALDTAASALITLLDVVSVLVLFRVTPALAGFSFTDSLLIAGLANAAFQLCDMCVGNIDTMREYIRTGRFDAVLLRPLRVLPQLVFGDFSPRRIGRAAQALVVLVVALSLADVTWTPARTVLVVIAPLSGAVIFGAVFVAGSTTAFWFVESGEFANAFTYGGRDFTIYPVGIYPGWFRAVFAYSLGFAFVAYFPGLALLGRPDPLGTPGFLPWCSPLVAVLAATAAALVWRVGVRHYRSTGS